MPSLPDRKITRQVALHRAAGKIDAECCIESFNGCMGDELHNGSLISGLDHARSAIVEWADDYNNFRPHSSLG
jgi:transposase InsO family protein